MLQIIVPPGEPPIDRVDAGSYSAPVMWDKQEWASPTPCHLRWIVGKLAGFEVLGRLDVVCPTCGKQWEVIWDPWRPGGRGHALWIE